jgi:hypothetical protein
VSTDSADFTGFDEGLVLDLTEEIDRPEIVALRPGTYDVVVEEVEFTESQKGSPMLRWVLRTQDENNRALYYYTVLDNPVGRQRTKEAIQRIAPDMNLQEFRPARDAEELAGRRARAKVKTRTWQGKRQNSVDDLLAPNEGNGFLD